MPHLIPRSKAQKPNLPGLALDARQVIVGDACALLIPTWSALVGTIGLIAAEFPLGKGSLQTRLFALQGLEHEFLLILRPEGAARTSGQVSHVFDRLAALGGRLREAEHPFLVGGGDVFVRYRDRENPTGYDLDGPPDADAGRALLLFAGGGEPVAVAKTQIRRLAFYDDFLVHLRPVATGEPAEGARYVLCATELARPLGRLLRRRALDVAVAQVSVGAGEETGKEMALFRIGPRGGQEGRIPSHWVANLEDLPGAILLDEIFLAGGDGESGRGVLSAAGMRPTVWMSNVAAELPESSLLILTGGTKRNLDVRPFPRFVSLDRLTTADVTAKSVTSARAASGEPGWPRTPIRLVPRDGASQPPAAALLSEEETRWLGHLVGRVPAQHWEAVRGAHTALGLLLVADQGTVDLIPFGASLRRHRAGNLLVPLAMGFEPEVPDEVLREKLALGDRSLAVHLPDARIDVPLEALRSLVDLIVSAAPLPAVEVRASAGARVEPQVVYVEEAKEAATPAAGLERPAGWLRRFLGLFFEWKKPR